MAINETIVKGRKFRKLVDASNKIWQRISYWTAGADVEFESGDDAETTLGAVKGITSDVSTVTEAGYAADALAVKTLNNNLIANGTNFYFDYQDGQYGYNTSSKRGADTFSPFSSGDVAAVFKVNETSVNGTYTATLLKGIGNKNTSTTFVFPRSGSIKIVINGATTKNGYYKFNINGTTVSTQSYSSGVSFVNATYSGSVSSGDKLQVIMYGGTPGYSTVFGLAAVYYD